LIFVNCENILAFFKSSRMWNIGKGNVRYITVLLFCRWSSIDFFPSDLTILKAGQETEMLNNV